MIEQPLGYDTEVLKNSYLLPAKEIYIDKEHALCENDEQIKLIEDF